MTHTLPWVIRHLLESVLVRQESRQHLPSSWERGRRAQIFWKLIIRWLSLYKLIDSQEFPKMAHKAKEMRPSRRHLSTFTCLSKSDRMKRSMLTTKTFCRRSVIDSQIQAPSPSLSTSRQVLRSSWTWKWRNIKTKWRRTKNRKRGRRTEPQRLSQWLARMDHPLTTSRCSRSMRQKCVITLRLSSNWNFTSSAFKTNWKSKRSKWKKTPVKLNKRSSKTIWSYKGTKTCCLWERRKSRAFNWSVTSRKTLRRTTKSRSPTLRRRIKTSVPHLLSSNAASLHSKSSQDHSIKWWMTCRML